MAYMLDKQELKPGLVIFRRHGLKHRNWYCRIKVPDLDRYKTIALDTSDINAAKDAAFDEDAELRFKVKHKMPVFDKTFSQVAQEYAYAQKARAKAGQISERRADTEASFIRAQLNPYVGHMQITLIGEDRWKGYPIWRHGNGKGRNGKKVSDWTIRSEMKTFRSIMLFAADNNYISETRVFRKKVKLSTPRREAFTPEEYRKLYTFARTWVKEARSELQVFYRTIAQNFILIMTNTGMRPPEAKNLRWRDCLGTRIDREGRQFFVLKVRGKGKFRELVAVPTVATYLERIRAISKATGPDDFVFTTHKGEPALTLYKSLIGDLLNKTGLLFSSSGSRMSSYCFRHTYATFRLMHNTDLLDLAKQMGTSAEMIQDYYGHITPTKRADAILRGLPGWDMLPSDEGNGDATAPGVNAGTAAGQLKPRTHGKREGKVSPTAGKASRPTRRR
jgi:integrase